MSSSSSDDHQNTMRIIKHPLAAMRLIKCTRPWKMMLCPRPNKYRLICSQENCYFSFPDKVGIAFLFVRLYKLSFDVLRGIKVLVTSHN